MKFDQLLFVAFLAVCPYAVSQVPQYRISVKGKVETDSRQPVINEKVVLVHLNDTLGTSFTDSLGQYAFPEMKMAEGTELKVIREKSFHDPGIDVIVPDKDVDFVLETILRPSHWKAKMDNGAYFDAGEYKIMHNFEVELLKELFREYPDLCIEFSLIQFKDESEKLAEKRWKKFEDLLEESEVNKAQYTINRETHVYSENSGQYLVYLPAIQGKVLSLEGPCNK